MRKKDEYDDDDDDERENHLIFLTLKLTSVIKCNIVMRVCGRRGFFLINKSHTKLDDVDKPATIQDNEITYVPPCHNRK